MNDIAAVVVHVVVEQHSVAVFGDKSVVLLLLHASVGLNGISQNYHALPKRVRKRARWRKAFEHGKD